MRPSSGTLTRRGHAMINGDDTIINHERIKEPAAELGRPMKT
jgi:hypothetical protein